MKRNVSWDLYFRDVDHEDQCICARTLEPDEDLGDFLENFVNFTDFGFNCFIQCNVWYTKEDNEK